MIITFLRLVLMLGISVITGVLGIIWLVGTHTSIWVTVGVKPFSILLLLISIILFEQVKRELSKIDRKENIGRKIDH